MIYRSNRRKRFVPSGAILTMTARYIGSCVCGALLEPGDMIKYDTASQKALCYECGRRRSELKESVLKEVAESTDCEQLIDAYRRLMDLPQPLSDDVHLQMLSLMHRLVEDFAGIAEARQFIASVADCSDNDTDFVAIRSKYPGPCRHCGTVIKVGRLCLYDKNARILHCIACDCQKASARFRSHVSSTQSNCVGACQIEESFLSQLRGAEAVHESDCEVAQTDGSDAAQNNESESPQTKESVSVHNDSKAAQTDGSNDTDSLYISGSPPSPAAI